MSERPIQILRDGSLKASIWRNQKRDGTSFYSTQFGKTYEDPKTGKPKDSNNFSGSDLLKLSRLAERAYSYEGKFRAEDKAAAAENTPQERQPNPRYR